MKSQRPTIAFGVILLLAGAALLVYQLQPEFVRLYLGSWFSWPSIITATGLVFILVAILSGMGGLAIPGSIISTVGLILYYQNTTGDWESWSFAWALIPASVGLGIIMMALINGKLRRSRPGFWLLIVNLVIFVVFFAFFRQNSNILLRYWPVLVIAIGVLVLVQALWPRKRIQG